ncbi:MAG: biotin/lipoate A/B protein ligase family protein [Candidatus Bathyarchaeia archaeon]
MDADSWRLIVSEGLDPYRNIALDEALARLAGSADRPATLRIYKNSRAAIIGRFQSVDLEVDLKACSEEGVKVVRRFTGGGAVYHDEGTLNYSIAYNRTVKTASEDVGETFMRLGAGVLQGLRLLGLEGELSEPNCILVDGKKICGAAGAMRWGSVFQHGSILVTSDLSMLAKILSPPKCCPEPSKRFVRSKVRPVTSINLETGRKVSVEDAAEALIQGFGRTLGAEFKRSEPQGDELELAESLYLRVYSRPEWNLMH